MASSSLARFSMLPKPKHRSISNNPCSFIKIFILKLQIEIEHFNTKDLTSHSRVKEGLAY